MPAMGFLGGSLLMACCGSLFGGIDRAIYVSRNMKTTPSAPVVTPAPITTTKYPTPDQVSSTESNKNTYSVQLPETQEFENLLVINLPQTVNIDSGDQLIQINYFAGGWQQAQTTEERPPGPRELQLARRLLLKAAADTIKQQHQWEQTDNHHHHSNNHKVVDYHNIYWPLTPSLTPQEGSGGCTFDSSDEESSEETESEEDTAKENEMKTEVKERENADMGRNGDDEEIVNTTENSMNEEEEKEEELPWWKTSIVYQVYPRSFLDSDSSGTGDLRGIASKADYLQDLGVGAVWLSPIFTSPMADFGYDISNFTDIDPVFGDMQDFDFLLKEFHDRGIRVILDFVPNHTSDQHPWFLSSVRQEDPYTDYYVWADPKGFTEDGSPIAPNNWVSVFRGSAWQWVPERQQFYLHQFLKEQPDLNFRNPDVRQSMKDMMAFWLERGVDGFRVDAVKHLYEVEDLEQDEPVALDSKVTDPLQYEYLNHTLTVNQPETLQVAMREWRQLLDHYPDRLLMAEVYDPDIQEVMKYYGNASQPLAHFPFNFRLIVRLENRSDVTGFNLLEIVNEWLENMPEGAWPNWVLGNHDRGRVASRLGTDLVDSLNMLTLLLPGTPVTYYGEEIGMEDMQVSWEDTQDPFGKNFGPERYQEFSRDPSRSPMLWDDSDNAGFSRSSATWLPINRDYKTVNVAVQTTAQESHLQVYRQLARLRQEDTFRRGNVSFPFITQEVFSFLRNYPGHPSYLVVMNLSEEEVEVDLSLEVELPTKATLVLRSVTQSRTTVFKRREVDMSQVKLIAGEGLVLKLPTTTV